MSKVIVLALGGNALGNDPEEQKEAVRYTSKSIVDLIEAGNQVILSHGNGPQVGMINLAMDAASKTEAGTPQMPFPECGAMSQGYIGYHLQNAIQNELRSRGIKKSVATLVTQVVVDKDDPAFQKAVDDSIKRQIADGTLAKSYDKWFMQPIPPANTKVGLPLSAATKDAWAKPNNKPKEEYAANK